MARGLAWFAGLAGVMMMIGVFCIGTTDQNIDLFLIGFLMFAISLLVLFFGGRRANND